MPVTIRTDKADDDTIHDLLQGETAELNSDPRSLGTVSIVLPTLNGERYLAQSIRSCLDQTYSDLELIVVDGGSSDRTRDTVFRFDDSRVRLVDQPANSGRISGALNLGLEHSTGQWWTWMQDDCYYEPSANEEMMGELIAAPNCGAVLADYTLLDQRAGESRVIAVGTADELLEHDRLGVCFLYRRHVVDAVGAYSLRHWLVQDYEYRLRVNERFEITTLHTSLLTYRLHDRSLTGRYGTEVDRAAIDMKRDLG